MIPLAHKQKHFCAMKLMPSTSLKANPTPAKWALIGPWQWETRVIDLLVCDMMQTPSLTTYYISPSFTYTESTNRIAR